MCGIGWRVINTFCLPDACTGARGVSWVGGLTAVGVKPNKCAVGRGKAQVCTRLQRNGDRKRKKVVRLHAATFFQYQIWSGDWCGIKTVRGGVFRYTGESAKSGCISVACAVVGEHREIIAR